MTIFKKTDSLELKDITKVYIIKQIIMYSTIPLILFLWIQSYYSINTITKMLVHRDTIKELLVLKSGMSEITVNRNKSIPNFCNNPGNLRPSGIKEIKDLAIGVISTNNGEFLFFANKEHGFQALEILLRKEYWNNTIVETIHRYAPEGAEREAMYVKKLTTKLKCTANTKVKDCNLIKLKEALAEIEGFINN